MPKTMVGAGGGWPLGEKIIRLREKKIKRGKKNGGKLHYKKREKRS